MAKKQKVHSLTGRINERLMREAFKAVKRNRGAAGIDKVSIDMFEKNLDANLASLMKDLKTKGTFVPKPLRPGVDRQGPARKETPSAWDSGCPRSDCPGSTSKTS